MVTTHPQQPHIRGQALDLAFQVLDAHVRQPARAAARPNAAHGGALERRLQIGQLLGLWPRKGNVD